MTFDMARAHAFIQDCVRLGVAIEEAIPGLLAYCRSIYPDEHWSYLKGLDLRGDVRTLHRWLAEVLADEAPGQDIAGLWFGIFEGILNDGQRGYRLYLSGSNSFDAGDPSCAWACDTSYWPARRYAPFAVLAAFPQLLAGLDAQGAELGGYIFPLGCAASAIGEVLRDIDHHLLVGQRDWRGIAVGFDDGDCVVLGLATPTGLFTLHSDPRP